MPIEELARSGRDTLRFGPMKPVGLRDPRTGKTPHAVVQLRCENLRADSYNLVGFQNHLKYGEQARILRMIPGLENAKFLRYGQIHRNTYINAPAVLSGTTHFARLAEGFHCGSVVRSGGIYRIDRDGNAGGNLCGRGRRRRGADADSARDSARVLWCTTSPIPRQSASSRRISPSICCRRWMRRHGRRFAISGSVTGCNAKALCGYLTDGWNK